MTFVHRLSLDMPAHGAFDAITDVPAIPQWIPAIRAARILSPGPLQHGAEFEQETHVAGIRFPILGEVTEFEPPSRFAYRYRDGVVAGLWNYRIAPAKRGCTVDVSIDFYQSALVAPCGEANRRAQHRAVRKMGDRAPQTLSARPRPSNPMYQAPRP